MIGPVLIVNDPEQPVKKPRLVEIYKNNVYSDIEKHTYKYAETNLPDVKVNNAVAADNSEDLDGAIIARYVEFRDAQLRVKLRFALAEITDEYADDEITLQENTYRYFFLLPEDFADNALRALAEYIHRFLVFGALFDWYSEKGLAVASVYQGQLDDLEEKISSILRGRSIAKRPLQPFGPAKKMY